LLVVATVALQAAALAVQIRALQVAVPKSQYWAVEQVAYRVLDSPLVLQVRTVPFSQNRVPPAHTMALQAPPTQTCPFEQQSADTVLVKPSAEHVSTCSTPLVQVTAKGVQMRVWQLAAPPLSAQLWPVPHATGEPQALPAASQVDTPPASQRVAPAVQTSRAQAPWLHQRLVGESSCRTHAAQ